jgi:periplasmic protein TonB
VSDLWSIFSDSLVKRDTLSLAVSAQCQLTGGQALWLACLSRRIQRHNKMKHLISIFVAILLLTNISTANAQNGDLNINGVASFEQLRKEYYVGALYLGWPGHDAAAIASMPGKKRMELRITADRWPALRFSQIWNQLITINNPSATINSNAMDIVAFTSIPKGDLVEGDTIVIELTGNNTTQVSLNGVTALRTDSPILFSMLLNTWIGQRPPSSEFKRDILELPKDTASTELVARFNSIHPNDARKKAIAAWGLKAEPEAAAATAVTAAAAAVPRPTPVAVPTPTATPAVPAKKAEPVAAAKSEAEMKAKETPVTAAPPVQPAVEAPQPAANEAKEKQKALYSAYASSIRKMVVKEIDYPKRAVKENIEGLVMIKVKVDRSGNLVGVDIVQPADDMLDAAAERAAQKAAPFPKPSDDLEGNIFETQIPIVFKLTQ